MSDKANTSDEGPPIRRITSITINDIEVDPALVEIAFGNDAPSGGNMKVYRIDSFTGALMPFMANWRRYYEERMADEQ